jgi:hypothetical protein
VQLLIDHPAARAQGRARNKHLALLSGLLYCESCATRMVYTYSGKKDCKYPYYLCLNAQRQGWAACPGKSLPARAIEESVLGRMREEQRHGFALPDWELTNRTRQVEAIQSAVERIGYDGVSKQISIRFHPAAITGSVPECPEPDRSPIPSAIADREPEPDSLPRSWRWTREHVGAADRYKSASRLHRLRGAASRPSPCSRRCPNAAS